MPDEREPRNRGTIRDFIESPLGYFSIGRYYLEQGRHREAAEQLSACIQRQPDYAAALMSLGDAFAGAGDIEKAREAFAKARTVALAQNHPTLADEIDERVEEL